MLKCIIVDDEKLAIDLLEDYIQHIPYIEITAKCKNVLEAEKVMHRQPIDLIFLDIQMPGMTGLQFVQKMTYQPIIIVVTAYEKYAVQGFKLDVLDYLMKPVAFDRFIKACNKASEFHQFKLNQKIKIETPSSDYIFVNADYSQIKINLIDIKWIQGLKDYLKIYLTNSNKPIIPLMSMKTIEEQLPDNQFIRIHKSYIIAIQQITSVRKNGIFIGEVELPIGGNYKDRVETLVHK